MKRPRHIGTPLIATSLACAFAASSVAMGPPPSYVPVDRLVRNLSAYTSEHPTEAEGWYALARAHEGAFASRSHGIYVADSLDVISPSVQKAMYEGIKEPPGKTVDPMPETPATDDELRGHLREALLAYRRAIELAPNLAKFQLGLASLLEGSTEFAGEIDLAPLMPDSLPAESDPHLAEYRSNTIDALLAGDARTVESCLRTIRRPAAEWMVQQRLRERFVQALLARRADPKPEVRKAVADMLRADWQEQTTEQYFTAFSLALVADSKADTQPINGVHQLIVHEAGTAYLRLVEARSARDDEAVRVATVQATLKALKDLPPPRGIEPIFLSNGASDSLASLVASANHTPFDLDGTGRPQRWSWVKPGTGILVWDPEHTGKITSGLQLFGSVTWWIFFEDGYHALDALDDNRDGELSGSELSGLAVWFDRNSNGVSDPGEVVPIEKTGIATISCRGTDVEDGCVANLSGLTMADGRVLPTYDWVATSSPVSEGVRPPSVAYAGLAALTTAGASFGLTRRRRRAIGPRSLPEDA